MKPFGKGGGEGGGLPQAGRLLRSLGAWLALYVSALALYNAIPHFREAMIHRFQVVPSVWLLEHTMPGAGFQAVGNSIGAPGLEVRVMSGCDGVEGWLLLVTAMRVFPMSWRRRWLGVAYGTALMYGLNLVRIVSLVHVAVRKPAWMEAAHLVVWQSLIVLVVGIFILIWLEPRREASSREREEGR